MSRGTSGTFSETKNLREKRTRKKLRNEVVTHEEIRREIVTGKLDRRSSFVDALLSLFYLISLLNQQYRHSNYLLDF
jgi:hypothetical protein